MLLIGLLDSPYVRRTAITLQLLGLPFEHRALSVFRHVDQFREFNPLVKAPSLVCDDGEVLMDSTLIIDYAETLAPPGKSLMPGQPQPRRHALRLIGLALVVCEKSVQIIYERELRPADKIHQPWLSRVQGQLVAACAALEQELQKAAPGATLDTIDQAGITTAVAWFFAREMTADVLDLAAYPALQAYSAAAEQLAPFRAAPHGMDTMGALPA